MVRVFLWILSFNICFCFLAKAQEFEIYKPFYGKWTPYNVDGNIFEGSVNILTIKTRPGSRTSEMLLIFDEQQRGFLCSQWSPEKEALACSVVSLNKKDISSKDRADLVTNQLADMPFFIIVLKIKNNNLEIMGHHLTDAKCINEDNCSYNLLSLLSK